MSPITMWMSTFVRQGLFPAEGRVKSSCSSLISKVTMRLALGHTRRPWPVQNNRNKCRFPRGMWAEHATGGALAIFPEADRLPCVDEASECAWSIEPVEIGMLRTHVFEQIVVEIGGRHRASEFETVGVGVALFVAERAIQPVGFDTVGRGSENQTADAQLLGTLVDKEEQTLAQSEAAVA